MRSKNNVKIASGQWAKRGTQLVHINGCGKIHVPGEEKPERLVFFQEVCPPEELEVLVPPAPKPVEPPKPKEEDED